MSSSSQQAYANWALELARAAASVCNYCDHVDHNEEVDRSWIFDAGHTLRRLACEISQAEEVDLLDLYVARLRAIEARNPLSHSGSFDGGARAAQARTWRELQLAQAEHDRYYHPDVLGLSKFGQLNHYALHVSKLAGAVAEVAQGDAEQEDFLARRLPDLLLFGIKLATVCGKALPDQALGSTRNLNERHLIAA